MSASALRRILTRAGRLAAGAFDALVPVSCVGCGRGVDVTGAPLCGLCRSRLPRLPGPRCVRCAEPLGNLYESGSGFERCGTCESWPEALVAADAPFAFDGLAAQSVRALKYRGWRSLTPFMAGAMLASVGTVRARLGGDARSARLVPVPLTPARRRERGFNQAEDLATELARLEAGQLCRALVRVSGGGRQAKAGGALRRANVQGRFRATGVLGRAEGGAIIIDDVLTTGATAAACADALAEAGFRRVAIVSFARTLRPLDAAATEGRTRHVGS